MIAALQKPAKDLDGRLPTLARSGNSIHNTAVAYRNRGIVKSRKGISRPAQTFKHAHQLESKSRHPSNPAATPKP